MPPRCRKTAPDPSYGGAEAEVNAAQTRWGNSCGRACGERPDQFAPAPPPPTPRRRARHGRRAPAQARVTLGAGLVPAAAPRARPLFRFRPGPPGNRRRARCSAAGSHPPAPPCRHRAPASARSAGLTVTQRRTMQNDSLRGPWQTPQPTQCHGRPRRSARRRFAFS